MVIVFNVFICLNKIPKFESIETVTKGQLVNASSPILTPACIFISFNELHPENALSPIDVNELGNTTDVNFWQFLNAWLPMVVIELPKSTDSKFIQLKKHSS